MVEFNSNNNNIIMTRGDTVPIRISVLTPSCNIYEPKSGDNISFYVYDKPNTMERDTPIITKQFNDGKNFTLNPEDTKWLKDGYYYYKVVITFAPKNNDNEKDSSPIRETICSGMIQLVN